LSLGFLTTSVYSRVPLLCSLILPPASKKNSVRFGSVFKRKWKRSAQLVWWRNFYLLDKSLLEWSYWNCKLGMLKFWFSFILGEGDVLKLYPLFLYWRYFGLFLEGVLL
jgi:hypothetical protein